MYPSNIDFVCISLTECSQRREGLHKIFAKLNIQPIWWIVDRHPDGGLYGCFESHYHVWTSLELTKEYTFIFEDDLQVDPSFDLHRFINILHNLHRIVPQHVDVLKFDYAPLKNTGYVNIPLKEYIQPTKRIHSRHVSYDDAKYDTRQIIVQRGYNFSGLAYIIHRPSFQRHAHNVRPYHGIHSDLALNLVCRNGMVWPPFFYQDFSNSTTQSSRSTGMFSYYRKLYLHDLICFTSKTIISNLLFSVALSIGHIKNVDFRDRRKKKYITTCSIKE